MPEVALVTVQLPMDLGLLAEITSMISARYPAARMRTGETNSGQTVEFIVNEGDETDG